MLRKHILQMVTNFQKNLIVEISDKQIQELSKSCMRKMKILKYILKHYNKKR